jgi:hypothetical protein
MGRHSAPDDDVDDGAAATTATIDLGPLDLGPPDGPDAPARSRGRHAQSGDDDAAGADEQPTQMIAPVDPGLEADFDDTHVTDVLVPPDPDTDVVAPEEAPAKPSRADRRAAKARAKADAAAGAAPAAPPKPAKPAKPTKRRDGETDTQADLRVLRENSAVRARSLAAVLVSFLLYTVVMIVIGRTEVYLLWIWIPIVVAGVLVGVVLDLAHREPKGAERPPPPLEPLG